MKPRLAILTDLHLLPEAEDQIRRLAGHELSFPTSRPATEQELINRTQDAEMVLVSPFANITASYLEACPAVKYIGLCGSSKANIDLTAVSQRGITLTSVVDYGDEPTAEFIIMQLIALARGTGVYQWRSQPCELMGKRIGIIGLGALGQAVAHLALAFKMQPSYFSRHHKPEWEAQGVAYQDLEPLLKSSEIIIVSSPTNTEILGETEFKLIPNGTVLVQASSGNVLNAAAFKHWIAHNTNYAIFDYAAGEQNYQEYATLPRVIFPKIIAGHTRETKQRLGQTVVRNLQDYLAKSGFTTP